jgi:hypothetical protein
MKLTDKQKTYLVDNRNYKTDYRQYVNKWIDRDDIPANVALLFDHILNHKAKAQTLTVMEYNSLPDLNIYVIENSAELFRRYECGWYPVKNRSSHNPKFRKKG